MSEKTMHLSQNSAATGTLDLEIQRLRKAATDALKEANLLDEKATLLSKEAQYARDAVRGGGLDVGWKLQQMSIKSQKAREANEKVRRANEDLKRAHEELQRTLKRARGKTRSTDTRQITIFEIIEGGLMKVDRKGR